jgi:predicted kinase
MDTIHGDKSMLFIFGGLPGVGKSELAAHLARQRSAVYLRIDTIEQAMRAGGLTLSGPEGYRVAYGLAEDNLRLGRSVVADSVNPLPITRQAWRDVAERAGVPVCQIEVICSDPAEHRCRVEGRTAAIPGLILPTWQEVVEREYHPWPDADRVIDTASRTLSASKAELDAAISAFVSP